MAPERRVGPEEPSTAASAPPSARPAIRAPLEPQLADYDRSRGRILRWIEPPNAPPAPLESVLPGALFETAEGRAFVAETRRSRADLHGHRPLGAFFDAPAQHLEQVVGDARLRGFDPRGTLFLDIEATGLDHGAGTLAFLIGLGFLEGETVVVRQLCLREPSEERAQLALLQEHLERFPYLVSFNGKSYDLSVLQTRLVMQRLYSRERSELKLRPHLDLLHLSKNLLRGESEDTRLGTLEAHALGHVRVDDIPGHLVPTCWFAWLRHRNPDPLAAVARHNLDDVLSMITLADLLLRLSAAPTGAERTPLRALNLARVLARRKHHAAAAEVARGIDPAELAPADRLLLHRAVADCARRLGDAPTQRDALASLVALAPDDVDARLELVRAHVKSGAGDLARAHAQHLASAAQGLTPPAARLVARVLAGPPATR